jgi:hypothetical protein
MRAGARPPHFSPWPRLWPCLTHKEASTNTHQKTQHTHKQDHKVTYSSLKYSTAHPTPQEEAKELSWHSDGLSIVFWQQTDFYQKTHIWSLKTFWKLVNEWMNEWWQLTSQVAHAPRSACIATSVTESHGWSTPGPPTPVSTAMA